ncbi:MAG TPA: HAMP domain-containing sensor histidine kinase [Pseudonocardiaceae bacterium]|nr:HAMP domain-containing sensor histidine kinase [Pseudonocardiaceae bacterium]
MRKGISRPGGLDQPVTDPRDAVTVRGLLHDVEHGLATLASLIDVVRGDSELSDESDLQLRRAERELAMLFAVISHWLNGQEGADGSGEVDVRALAREVAQLAEVEHGVTVELVPGPDVLVPVSAEVVWRVITNVVDNAARAAGPGGRVEVSVGRDTEVVVEVRDTGPGFDGVPDGTTGLRVVTSLLDSVGGRFEVLTGTTDGTTVRAVFPPRQRDGNG